MKYDVLKPDKILHFVAGICLGFFGSWITFLIQFKFMFISGFGLSLIVGLLKELLWDKLLKKGTPEWLDFLWTAIGGFIMSLFMYILVKLTL